MLVEIRNLRIQFPTATGLSDAVRNVSLTLGQEKLGIVGESGSGKSLTARSILRLLPSNADRHCRQTDIRQHRRAACRRGGAPAHPRHSAPGLILQDPKFSLNPVMTAGAQIAEAWRVHRGGSRQAGATGGDRPAGAGADPRSGSAWPAPIRTNFRAAWASG